MRKFGLVTLLFLGLLLQGDTARAQIEETSLIQDEQSTYSSDPVVTYEPDIVKSDLIAPSMPQSSDRIMPPYQPAIYHFGQDHRYSVIFRGNGEAVVYFRGAFTNEGENQITSVELEAQDDLEISQLSAYQIIKKPYCASYGREGACEIYTDPDYYEPYSYGGVSEYYEADVALDGNKLTLQLPEEILPGSQGAYLVFFRAGGIADKSPFGGYRYNLETFRVDDNIKSLNIGIEGDPDWVFKGSDAAIEYVSSIAPVTDSLLVSEKGARESRNTTFDSLVSGIGYGMINKNANGLAPMENMVVEGVYAKNYVGLYYKELALVVAVVILVVIVTIILVLKMRRNSKTNNDDKISSIHTTNLKIMMLMSHLLIPTITVIYVVGVIFLFDSLDRFMYNSSMIAPMVMIMVLMSFLFFISVFVGSAIYFGIKKGVGWGLANLFINIFIFLILMSIVIIVMFVFMDSGNQIMQYAGGGIGVMDAAKPY